MDTLFNDNPALLYSGIKARFPDFDAKPPLIISVARKTGGTCDKEFKLMGRFPEKLDGLRELIGTGVSANCYRLF